MLAGDLRHEGFQSDAVHEALDLCLSCKACKTECPVQVDMAAYKSEFLAQRYKGRCTRCITTSSASPTSLPAGALAFPRLTNALLTGPSELAGQAHRRRSSSERQLPSARIRRPKHPRRSAPSPHRKSATFDPTQGAQRSRPHRRWSVLWPDTWNNYYHPQSLASRRVRFCSPPASALQRPRGHICCGRPLYDFGFLGAAPGNISPASSIA